MASPFKTGKGRAAVSSLRGGLGASQFVPGHCAQHVGTAWASPTTRLRQGELWLPAVCAWAAEALFDRVSRSGGHFRLEGTIGNTTHLPGGLGGGGGAHQEAEVGGWRDLFLERESWGLTVSDGNVSLKVRTRTHLASCLGPP